MSYEATNQTKPASAILYKTTASAILPASAISKYKNSTSVPFKFNNTINNTNYNLQIPFKFNNTINNTNYNFQIPFKFNNTINNTNYNTNETSTSTSTYILILSSYI